MGREHCPGGGQAQAGARGASDRRRRGTAEQSGAAVAAVTSRAGQVRGEPRAPPRSGRVEHSLFSCVEAQDRRRGGPVGRVRDAAGGAGGAAVRPLFDSRSLSCLLYGLHKLGWPLRASCCGGGSGRPSSAWGTFTPQGLATSLLALAHAEEAAVEEAFLHGWKSAALQSLPSFNAVSLAMAMQGLARLPRELSGGGARRAVEGMRAQSFWRVSPGGDGAVPMEARPRDYKHFLSKWFARARQVLAQFNDADLTNTLWALSKFNLRDDEFLEQWTRAARPWLGCFSAQELAVCLRAMELEMDPYCRLVDEWLLMRFFLFCCYARKRAVVMLPACCSYLLNVGHRGRRSR